MPVATFSTTDANDGGGRLTSDTYPPSGGFIATDGDTVSALRMNIGASPTYWVGNACFRWDCSSILGQTATGAEIDLYVIDRDMDGVGYEVIADLYDFGGEATTSADITTSDTGNIITAVPVLSLPLGSLYTFTVSDLSGLNTALAGAGIYGVRFKLNQDSAPSANNNYVDFAASEHATHPAPLLRVTYAGAPSGGGGRMLVGVG